MSSDIAKWPLGGQNCPQLRTIILKQDHFTSDVCFHASPPAASQELPVSSSVLSVCSCVSWPIWQSSHDAKCVISGIAPGHQSTAAATQAECLRAKERRREAESLHCSHRHHRELKSLSKQFPETAGQRAFVPQLKIHMRSSLQNQPAGSSLPHNWKCFHWTPAHNVNPQCVWTGNGQLQEELAPCQEKTEPSTDVCFLPKTDLPSKYILKATCW
jgi:hypothetical protein